MHNGRTDGQTDPEEEAQHVNPADERRVLGSFVDAGLWPRKADGTTVQRVSAGGKDRRFVQDSGR